MRYIVLPKNQILFQRCHVMGDRDLAGVVLDCLTIFIDKCDLNITVRLTTWIVRSPVVANAVCHAIAEVGVPVAGQISIILFIALRTVAVEAHFCFPGVHALRFHRLGVFRAAQLGIRIVMIFPLHVKQHGEAVFYSGFRFCILALRTDCHVFSIDGAKMNGGRGDIFAFFQVKQNGHVPVVAHAVKGGRLVAVNDRTCHLLFRMFVGGIVQLDLVHYGPDAGV